MIAKLFGAFGLLLLIYVASNFISWPAHQSTNPDANEAEIDALAADWILTGGKIFTVDDDKPWAQAVAIKGGKFVYVGDDDGATAFVSNETQTSDLDGRLVIPGMVDSHAHPGLIDLDPPAGSLPETNQEDILAAVKAYADSNPELEWLHMCCFPVGLYGNGRVGPNKRDLDGFVPDRPVWITSDIGHSAWVNSKALEILGIDRNTPDPLPGISYFVRDENGDPNGWIKELYWNFGEDIFPVDTERHEKGMSGFLNYLSRFGVTTVYDAGNEEFDDRVYAFMANLDRDGKLPLRYEGTFDAFIPEQIDVAIAEMQRFRQIYGGKRLRFNTIKMYIDGTNENRTGAMLEAYEDDPGNMGTTMMTVTEVRDFLLKLHDAKMDLHVHVVGDRGVRTILDAVEAAGNTVDGALYPRVTISHLDIIDPADYSRIKELGVTANYTPWWHGVNFNDPVSYALGPERYARTLILKPLFDLGAVVTFSSDDWSYPALSPFLGMQVGHNRQYPAEWTSAKELEAMIQQGYEPSAWRGPASEMLDLELMIRGYTINGAYQLRMEDQIGSIEVGKLADLVVLDENLFEMDPYDIHTIKPSAVMMEGELIHGQLTN